MPRKTSPEEVFRRAEARGAGEQPQSINGLQVFRKVEGCTKADYKSALEMWNG
jgi:hypothetical protein